jgi:hypothetical protein
MKTILHTSNSSIRQLRKRPSTIVDLASSNVNIRLEGKEAKAFFEEWPRGFKTALTRKKNSSPSIFNVKT